MTALTRRAARFPATVVPAPDPPTERIPVAAHTRAQWQPVGRWQRARRWCRQTFTARIPDNGGAT